MTIQAVAPVAQAYAVGTVATSAVRPASPSAPPRSAYGQDTYVASGYVANTYEQNIIYGQGKNIGLRIIDKALGLKSSYIEAAFIDKTPQTAMDIEAVDFNLHVRAGEVAVSDVDATLTVETILRRRELRTGKKAPISDLRVAFDPDNQVRVEGKFKALGFKIPFSVSGQINVDTAGQIRYDLGKAKVAGVGVNGLMNTFGLTVDKLLKLNNPLDGYYTHGNTLVVDIGRTVSQMDNALGLHASIRGVRTQVGQLQLLVGDRPQDAQRVLAEKQIQEPAYVKAEGGHAYIDGFFVKEGRLAIYDRTPESPLNINAKGPEPERAIVLHQGHVGVTEQRFTQLLQEELGDSDTLTNLNVRLGDTQGKVSGKLFGFVPLSVNMTLGATEDGRLMFTPSRTKAFGFIPVPGGLVRGQLQKAINGGETYGKGIALGQMNGIDLGHVNQVSHQPGYLVISSGRPSQN